MPIHDSLAGKNSVGNASVRSFVKQELRECFAESQLHLIFISPFLFACKQYFLALPEKLRGFGIIRSASCASEVLRYGFSTVDALASLAKFCGGSARIFQLYRPIPRWVDNSEASGLCVPLDAVIIAIQFACISERIATLDAHPGLTAQFATGHGRTFGGHGLPPACNHSRWQCQHPKRILSIVHFPPAPFDFPCTA